MFYLHLQRKFLVYKIPATVSINLLNNGMMVIVKRLNRISEKQNDFINITFTLI